MATKPLPVPDASSEEFWKAAAAHQLVIQRCDVCGHFAHPPVALCDNCLTTTGTFTFTPVSGRGRLVSWIVMHDAFVPGFRDEIPYVIADVQLEEQASLRYVARLVDGADVALHQGDPTEVVFEDVAPDLALPHLRLAGGQA